LELENIINRFDAFITSYQSDSRSFQEYVLNTMDQYKQAIFTADLYGSEIKAFTIEEADLKIRINQICDGLTDTINHFFNVSRTDGVALKSLEKVIKDAKLFANHSLYFRTNELSLYRLRGHDNTKHAGFYERKELFHLPFEMANKASTMRYSLNGIPCLYVANSVYVAWEEMRKQPKEYAVSLFKNQSPLHFVELDSTPFYKRKYENSNDKYDDLIDYAMLFPIILCSALKIKNNDEQNPFKPEYVIPQLLLECSKTDFIGIRYISTRVDSQTEGIFWNYAIPVKTVSIMGYCERLKRVFSMSEVKIFNFYNPYDKSPFSSFKSNEDVLRVFEEGVHYDFCETIFSGIEYELHLLPQEIDF
jgi:hypothetical protein